MAEHTNLTIVTADPSAAARLTVALADCGLAAAVAADLGDAVARAETCGAAVALVDDAAWVAAPEAVRAKAAAARSALALILLRRDDATAPQDHALEAAAAAVDTLPWDELTPGLLAQAVRHAETVRTFEARLARQRIELNRYGQLYAHHLRGPIGSLQRMLDLSITRLGDDAPSSGAALDSVARARDAARRVGALLDGLERNARALDVADIAERPLDAAAARALDRLRGDLGAMVQAATVTIAPLPVTRHCARQFESVFCELIKNALTFNAAAQPTARIAALDQSSEREVVIAVDDNGIGVEPAYVEEIFEPLTRLHGPQRFPGAGLGLTLCRTVVEANGGRIWAERSPLGGARIAFALPRRPM